LSEHAPTYKNIICEHRMRVVLIMTLTIAKLNLISYILY